MPDIRLVYFDIRGIAEPIRWMLKIADQPFEDEKIPLDVWGPQKKRKSNPDIYSVGPRRSNPDITERHRKSNPNVLAGKFANFIGQLPILNYDDFSLTQAHTVMRYIAKKYGFNGNNSEEEARAEEVVELIYDLRLCVVQFHGTHFQSKTPDIIRHTVFRDFNNEPASAQKEVMREDLCKNIFPKYFRKFDSLLKQSKGDYIAGASLTYADFAIANFLNVIETLVDPNCLDNFPDLKTLQQRVLMIPQIKILVEEQDDSLNKEYPYGKIYL